MTRADAQNRRNDPWGPHPLEEGGETTVEVGPLSIHLARAAGEIRLAHVRRPLEPEGATAVGAGGGPAERPEAPAEREPPQDRDVPEEREAPQRAEVPDEELEWSRWAAGDAAAEVSLVPAFPDRPLVVAPEEPFHLLAGAEARIYVRVPLWVKIEMKGRRGTTTLARLPTIPASDTWWGTVEDGELGYWLTTHARRSVSDDLFRPFLAMCPLQLVNRSDDDLDVDKIALRTAYLTLYRDGDRIWSDETRVRYQGEADGSRLEMAGKPPLEARAATLLAEPALRMARGFRARTFGRLRTIHGWMT